MAKLNTAKREHISQVDYIRAIASLAVALFHLGGKTLPVLKYAWLGVQMFFVLSGFIICYAIPKNYDLSQSGKFITKRLIRIEPPYIISIILVLVAHFLFSPDYRPDWLNITCHLAYINNFTGEEYLSPVYWTLGLEFQFYLLIAVLFPLVTRKFGFVVVLLLCLPGVFHFGSNLISVFPVFALGIIFFLYHGKNIKPTVAFACFLIATIFCYLSVGAEQTISSVFALIILCLPIQPNKFISFFARISFSLYLTHDVIGSNYVIFLGGLLPKTFFFKGIEYISGVGLSILFAYLFYKFVEAPFLSLSRKIQYHPQ